LYFNQSYLLKEDRYVFYMGTRIGNLKSKIRRPIEHLFLRKGVSKFSDEIAYDDVFKNHAVLMEAYGAALERDSRTPDWFFRRWFVESHIYKKLQSLRKIYLVEIASHYNSDNNPTRTTLDKLVEDLDKFSSCLFYFPNIGWKEFLLYILPSIAAVTVVAYNVRAFIYPSWSQWVNAVAYQILLISLGLTLVVVFLIINPFFAVVSFIDKRRFFIFPEYKPRGFFDKLKKWFESFLGKNIEGTIYEKENKLFHSLRMKKEPEYPVDIVLFMFIIIFALAILDTLSMLPNQVHSLVWLLIALSLFFFVRRKAF